MEARNIASFLIGVVLCAGICALWNCTLFPPADISDRADLTVPLEILDGVPDVRQAEYYSCGASSFQAVLAYWGISSFETDLRVILNTTPTHGTYPWDMVKAAESLGLEAEWRDNLTLADLEESIGNRIPVIIDGQRFRESGKTWEDSWSSGHYMVVMGIDNESVYLEDPFLIGTRLTMNRDDFLQGWHDYEGEMPYGSGTPKYYNVGVFIRGKSPAANPEFTTWDVIPTLVPYAVRDETGQVTLTDVIALP